MWLKWLWDAGRDSLILGVNALDSSLQIEEGSERNLLPQTFYHQTHLHCHGAHLGGFSWTALHGACSIVFPPEFVEGTAFVLQVFVDFLCLVAEVECHVKPCRPLKLRRICCCCLAKLLGFIQFLELLACYGSLVHYWTYLTSFHHVFTRCINSFIGFVKLRVANDGPRLVVRTLSEIAVNGRSNGFQ